MPIQTEDSVQVVGIGLSKPSGKNKMHCDQNAILENKNALCVKKSSTRSEKVSAVVRYVKERLQD